MVLVLGNTDLILRATGLPHNLLGQWIRSGLVHIEAFAESWGSRRYAFSLVWGHGEA
jgi:hypothetical protein